MAFTWTTEPPLSAAEVADLGLDTEFATQAAAEAWLGENWELLDDAGATSVTLLGDGELVYGPMSLAPE